MSFDGDVSIYDVSVIGRIDGYNSEEVQLCGRPFENAIDVEDGAITLLACR